MSAQKTFFPRFSKKFSKKQKFFRNHATKSKKCCVYRCRGTRVIRTSFLATNIRHQFVKHLECINIQSSAFSCCWRIFVSQKISDLKALIFRWFWVRRTTQGINLARTTSRKAPKIKTLRLVRIILVTLHLALFLCEC